MTRNKKKEKRNRQFREGCEAKASGMKRIRLIHRYTPISTSLPIQMNPALILVSDEEFTD